MLTFAFLFLPQSYVDSTRSRSSPSRRPSSISFSRSSSPPPKKASFSSDLSSSFPAPQKPQAGKLPGTNLIPNLKTTQALVLNPSVTSNHHHSLQPNMFFPRSFFLLFTTLLAFLLISSPSVVKGSFSNKETKREESQGSWNRKLTLPSLPFVRFSL